MQNVAFIPVRGGSKSIPFKNIKEFCGKPLVYWVIKAASECPNIDKVYVSTDNSLIKQVVEELEFDKVIVIDRSEYTATDTASTESVMMEFAMKYEFDNIALIQATSPLLTEDDLTKGFNLFLEDDVDSVLSAVKQKRFNWKLDENGYAYADNYDVFHRPRRQEFDGYYVENGAFYITSKEKLLQSQNRISGNIKIVDMEEDSFWEIDEPKDWNTVESLMKKRHGKLENLTFSNIEMFLTDCDGCLTDGGMYYSEKGDEIKKFNTKDGMAFGILKAKGIRTGIITGEKVKLNQRRADKLQVDYFIDGCMDKVSAIKKLCKEAGVSPKNVLYVGDDINDLGAIMSVGYGCCVANAHRRLIENAYYVTKKSGGDGAIREIVDLIIDDEALVKTEQGGCFQAL